MIRHSVDTQTVIYVSPAVDTTTAGGRSLSEYEASAVASLNPKERAELPDHTYIGVGLPCMITHNVKTRLGLANGSRGKITAIALDPREPAHEPGQVLHTQRLLLSDLLSPRVYSR